MVPLSISDVLREWLAAINSQDVAGLSALMDKDFVFVDSLSNRITGSKSMEAGWRGYFAMCPDYWVRVDRTMADGDTMLIAGEAGGTIKGEHGEPKYNFHPSHLVNQIFSLFVPGTLTVSLLHPTKFHKFRRAKTKK